MSSGLSEKGFFLTFSPSPNLILPILQTKFAFMAVVFFNCVIPKSYFCSRETKYINSSMNQLYPILPFPFLTNSNGRAMSDY